MSGEINAAYAPRNTVNNTPSIIPDDRSRGSRLVCTREHFPNSANDAARFKINLARNSTGAHQITARNIIGVDTLTHTSWNTRVIEKSDDSLDVENKKFFFEI